MHLGWPSQYIPILINGNYTFQISKEESSYLNGVLLFGEIIGASGYGLIIDFISRKDVIVVAFIPFILSWLLIGVASSSPLMFVGRFIAGFSGGLIFPAIPIYLTEISGPKTKSFGTWCPISLWTGILIMYSLSGYIPLNISAFVSISISVVILCFFYCMPESPYFYLTKENTEDALKSLKALRGGEDVTDEMKIMSASVKEQIGNEGQFSEIFTVKSNRKSLFICLGKSNISKGNFKLFSIGNVFLHYMFPQ